MYLSAEDNDIDYDGMHLRFVVPKLVDEFLALNPYPKNRWICQKCKHYIKDLDKKEQILKLSAQFSKSIYQRCKNCAAKNYFELLPEGKIIFRLKIDS